MHAPLLADDPMSPVTFVNYGVLGAIVAALLLGWLWAKPAVDRIIEERDRLVTERNAAWAQRDAMAEVLQDKLLPVVGDFVRSTQAFLPVLQDIQRLGPLLQELVRGGHGDSTPPRRR